MVSLLNARWLLPGQFCRKPAPEVQKSPTAKATVQLNIQPFTAASAPRKEKEKLERKQDSILVPIGIIDSAKQIRLQQCLLDKPSEFRACRTKRHATHKKKNISFIQSTISNSVVDFDIAQQTGGKKCFNFERLLLLLR
jgi:hypothetical protein